ncbi:MAG: peptidase [Clostridiales bacterium]|nr:peptidase [Clostridiales bacterium]
MFNYSYNNGYNYLVWDNYWRSYRINSETAVQIALQRVPGQVIKIELDYENGILVYEIDIRTQTGVYEVHVDAIAGQVLKVERENNFD